MLNLSLKQTVVAIILIAVLLMTLAGNIYRGEVARSTLAGPHSGHPSGWYCPAPPILC